MFAQVEGSKDELSKVDEDNEDSFGWEVWLMTILCLVATWYCSG